MSNNSIVPLPLDQIEASPLNTRKSVSEESQNELKESLHLHGLLQPIIVRRMDKDRYQVVIGSRRLAAAKALGWKKIEGRIRRLTNGEALRLILVENNQREDVHPLDEADGFRRLIDAEKVTISQVAEVVSRSDSYVAGRLRLLKLCPQAMASYMQGEMTLSVAMKISRIAGESDQLLTLEFCLAQKPSMPALERFITEKIERSLANAPWDITDKKLEPEAGPCSTCQKTSRSQAVMFEDMERDRCLDTECFDRKHVAWNQKSHEADPNLVNVSPSRSERDDVYGRGKHTQLVENIPASACCNGIFVDGPQRGQIVPVCVHPDYVNAPKLRGEAVTPPARVMKLAAGVKDDLEPHATIFDAIMALAMKRCGPAKTKEILAGRDAEVMSTEDKGRVLLALLLVALHCPEDVLKEIGKDYKVKF